MRKFCTVICGLLLSAAGQASEAESASFRLDLHYESRGEVFPGEQGTEVSGLSSRWTALTTTLAADSNSDGIPDWWEQMYGVTVGSLAPQDDTDGDGYSNLAEFNAGSNPIVPDVLFSMSSVSQKHLVDTDGLKESSGASIDLNEAWSLSSRFLTDTVGLPSDVDRDGLPDWYENLYGLNPNLNDAMLDPDGDGRTNLQEYNAGTNPMLIDDWTKSSVATDEPFVTDTRVYYTGGNPTFDVAFAVIRMSNAFICDTGGLYYDWDGDGIPNWWEARYSRDGGKTGLKATDDDDNDGLSNHDEFVAYTDPTNSASKFVIGLAPITVVPVVQAKMSLLSFAPPSFTMANAAESLFALQWISVKGRTYAVYEKNTLEDGWPAEPIIELNGTDGVLEYTPQEASASKFFKVTVRLSDDYYSGQE